MEFKQIHDVLHELADKAERSWLRRVFWHSVNVQWYTPPVLTGRSWELDWPNRKSRAAIIRYSWRRALVLGFWGRKGYDEDTALLEATLYGRERTHEERRAWDDQRLFLAEEASLELHGGQPGLRVRATVDDGLDAR